MTTASSTSTPPPRSTPPSAASADPSRRAVAAVALLALAACPAADEPQRIPIRYLVPDLVLDGPELYKPADIAFDAAGRIYVLDAGNFRLYRYTPEGQLEREIGRRGEGPGEFPALYEFSSRLEIRDDTLIVAMPQTRVIQVRDTERMEVTRQFKLPAWPGNVVFDGEFLHVTHARPPEGRPSAAIYAYSLAGEFVGAYGDRLRPDWEEPGADRMLAARARTMLAAGRDGTVYEAARWWPLLRAYRNQELLWERWLDFDWFEEVELGKRFAKPRDRLDSFSAADLPPLDEDGAPILDEADPMSIMMVTQSIAAARDAHLMLNATYLQVLAAGGPPSASYKLLRPGADPADPEDRVVGVVGLRFAVSVDGQRACVARARDADVLCYRLANAP